jgi:hypothetical protein
MSRYEPSDYMHWVTDNVETFVKGEQNLVACVYCVEIYETDVFMKTHGCLICAKCNVDALMVVKHSPLLEMSDEDRMKKLAEWHKKGFTPMPRGSKTDK